MMIARVRGGARVGYKRFKPSWVRRGMLGLRTGSARSRRGEGPSRQGPGLASVTSECSPSSQCVRQIGVHSCEVMAVRHFMPNVAHQHHDGSPKSFGLSPRPKHGCFWLSSYATVCDLRQTDWWLRCLVSLDRKRERCKDPLLPCTNDTRMPMPYVELTRSIPSRCYWLNFHLCGALMRSLSFCPPETVAGWQLITDCPRGTQFQWRDGNA